MYKSSIYHAFIFQSGYTVGVIHVGAPACGMNAAVRSFVRNCIYRGDTVIGIHDGIEGLIEGNVRRYFNVLSENSVSYCFFFI